MSGVLCLHTGGHVATRDQVFAVEAPEPTKSWFPVSHREVLSKVEELLKAAGYTILREQLGLSHSGNRFFGVIDLESHIVEGVTLALGLRNSIDKSFPYGLAGGSRTFVCDNLSLDGDWDELTITRKHTRNGHARFVDALANGISKLGQYRDLAEVRFGQLQSTPVSDETAEAILLRAFEQELLSHVALREAVRQWRKPDFDWGVPSRYSLYQAMTTPIQRRAITNPQAFSRQTMRLMELVAPKGGDNVIDVSFQEEAHV
jgi:Domain of unknown function (DUF932)